MSLLFARERRLIETDDMIKVRWAAVVLFGSALAAADFPPVFSASGVARGTRPARMVVPGTILTIYGGNLGPWPGKCTGISRPSNWPREFCGTQVLIGDMPAELLYVSHDQINFKVPQDSPREGIVDVRVVYNGQFSQPVSMKAGFEPTTVALDGPVYTDMPVWLKIDVPYEFAGAVGYPGVLSAAGFGCNQVEVRRNGQMLTLLPGSNWTRYGGGMAGNICQSYPPAGDPQSGRLPLHLLYRFDVPGVYEVRYSLFRAPVGFAAAQTAFRVRSEWTPIEVLAARAGERSAWLQSLCDHPINDAVELVTNTLPSLLGVPDDASFEILGGYLYHPSPTVRQFAMYGLTYWPEEYVLPKLQVLEQTRGPSDAIARYFRWQRAAAGGRQ